MNILFAEDDELLAQVFRLHAEQTGYQMCWVDNGDAAVQQALSYQFDLLLMDIQMPVLDGISAMQLLRQLGYDRPIVAMSAEAITATGFDLVLTKPLDWHKVQQHLHEFQPITALTLDVPPELKNAYLAHLDTLIKQMAELSAQQNWVDFLAIVHQLKGSAASFDLTTLSEQADLLQHEWKSLSAAQRAERATHFLEQCKECKLK